MGSIEINGKKVNVEGTNILIQYGKVIVDGNVIEDNTRSDFKVVINGNFGNITCTGSDIKCIAIYFSRSGGDVHVTGDVKGGISCEGDCACRDVFGYLECDGNVNMRNRCDD